MAAQKPSQSLCSHGLISPAHFDPPASLVEEGSLWWHSNPRPPQKKLSRIIFSKSLTASAKPLYHVRKHLHRFQGLGHGRHWGPLLTNHKQDSNPRLPHLSTHALFAHLCYLHKTWDFLPWNHSSQGLPGSTKRAEHSSEQTGWDTGITEALPMRKFPHFLLELVGLLVR